MPEGVESDGRGTELEIQFPIPAKSVEEAFEMFEAAANQHLAGLKAAAAARVAEHITPHEAERAQENCAGYVRPNELEEKRRQRAIEELDKAESTLGELVKTWPDNCTHAKCPAYNTRENECCGAANLEEMQRHGCPALEKQAQEQPK